MTLVMGSLVVHADDSAKVKLTIHWSSVDGLDLMDPIVVDNIEPGTEIREAYFSNDLSWYTEIFFKDGYLDYEWNCRKPITEYSKLMDLENDEYPYNYQLTEDTDVYRPVFKYLDTLEFTVTPPGCGESTTTPGEGNDISYNDQTNRPQVSFPAGSKYHFEEGYRFTGPIWITKESIESNLQFGPYIGPFTYGQDYYFTVWIECDFGYYFSKNAAVTANNAVVEKEMNNGNYFGIYGKVTPSHKWDTGEVTTAPTTSAEGVKTYTCTGCGETYTEAIPKLNPPSDKGKDGTVFGPGASADAAEAAILALPDDKDPAGSVFNILQLKASKTTKNSIKLAWKKASGAAKYVIYANACGKGKKYQKLATVSGTSTTVKKVAGAKLKKGTYYKFLMVAVNSSGKVVSTSKTVHAATLGGKVGNPAKVTTKAKKNKVTVKVKKTFKLAAKQTGKKIKKHRAIKYETMNAKVATVSAKGVIKGVRKGTCYIYAYAQNGVAAKIKVTVK